MGNIRILDSFLVNQISAGEVVERPASVVKELVENALDASSSKITITLRDGGMSWISVQDNGTGMDADDLKLALERHATSKLPSNNVHDIKYYGFRGEALASINAISRLTLMSKTAFDSHGFKIDSKGITPCSHLVGTSVIVQDIFYATPVRLKFLKSSQTEMNKCVEWVKRLALSYPLCEFIVKDDEKEVLSYPKTSSWMDRMHQVLGHQNSFCLFNYKNDTIKLYGALSLPTFHKSSPSDQFFFINGRFIKDKMLSIVLRQVYEDLLSPLRYPVVLIYLTLPCDEVDVNVHPCKTEVRFRDPSSIRSLLFHQMNQVLHTQKTSPHLAQMAVERISRSSPSSRGISFKAPIPSINPVIYQPVPLIQDECPVRSIGQFKKTYLLVEKDNSLVIIDQHAAHERILYEKLKTKTFEKQLLLFPEIFSLEPSDFHTLKQWSLEEYGFRYDLFEDNCTVVLKEIPSLLDGMLMFPLIESLCLDLKSNDDPLTLKEILLKKLSTYACHHSIRSGKIFHDPEVLQLVSEMEQTDNSAQCNHGRPTYIEFHLKDIEALFERRM